MGAALGELSDRGGVLAYSCGVRLGDGRRVVESWS